MQTLIYNPQQQTIAIDDVVSLNILPGRYEWDANFEAYFLIKNSVHSDDSPDNPAIVVFDEEMGQVYFYKQLHDADGSFVEY